MPNLVTNITAMGSYPGSKDEVDHQLSHERFVDRLQQVYGKEGLDKRMEVVSERLENRPEILNKAGMARIYPYQMFGRVPTMWSRRMPYKFMGESIAYGRPEMWGNSLGGAYIPGGDSQITGIPTAYIYSESSKKPESPFTTTPPSQTSLSTGVATFGRPTKEFPRGAYMPQETSIANHELAHHAYTDSPEAIKMKGTEVEKEAFGDLLGGLGRGGLPAYEVPVYLSEVIHWYANRNLDPEKLANDPEYRLNAQRDIPATEEDHAKAWDAFGEMLETVSPEEGWGTGKWDRSKWESMNKERNKVLRILPEVVQQDNLPANMIA